MRHLNLIPLAAGYSTKDGKEVVSQALAGGAARYRRDILRASATVSASFLLDAAGFYYLRSFYKSATQSGALPFTVQLLLDHPWLTTHTAHFVPESIGFSQKECKFYHVTVDLDVMPLVQTQNDMDFVDLFEEFGSDFTSYVDILHNTVNVMWPQVL